MSDRCCNEYRCRRTKPIVIRRGGLSGRWYAITDYGPVKGYDHLIEARQKHDITANLIAALIDAGWTPPQEQSDD